MRNQKPRVVIGMPVYNGENYVRKAVDSILAQTFTNFLLIISDNASSDGTAEACREYAGKDHRVIYHRQPENIGAAPNFNYVFQPHGAPYFKWAAHDDVLKPDYLLRCVELLDRNAAIAIAHSRSLLVGPDGKRVGTFDHQLRLNGFRVRDRFRRLIWAVYFTEVFGLMRSELIGKTKLYGSFVGSDRNFIAEMLIQGDVGYVEEYLFCRREHDQTYCKSLKDDAARLKWFDPKAKIPGFLDGPMRCKGFILSLLRMPMPMSDRLYGLGIVMEWVMRRGVEISLGDKDQYRNKLIVKGFGGVE